MDNVPDSTSSPQVSTTPAEKVTRSRRKKRKDNKRKKPGVLLSACIDILGEYYLLEAEQQPHTKSIRKRLLRMKGGAFRKAARALRACSHLPSLSPTTTRIALEKVGLPPDLTQTIAHHFRTLMIGKPEPDLKNAIDMKERLHFIRHFSESLGVSHTRAILLLQQNNMDVQQVQNNAMKGSKAERERLMRSMDLFKYIVTRDDANRVANVLKRCQCDKVAVTGAHRRGQKGAPYASCIARCGDAILNNEYVSSFSTSFVDAVGGPKQCVLVSQVPNKDGTITLEFVVLLRPTTSPDSSSRTWYRAKITLANTSTYPFALLRDTGPVIHIDMIQTLTKNLGRSLDASGIHPLRKEDDPPPIPIRSEGDIYRVLQLPYTPPCQRHMLIRNSIKPKHNTSQHDSPHKQVAYDSVCENDDTEPQILVHD